MNGRELHLGDRPIPLTCQYMTPRGGGRKKKLANMEENGFNCSVKYSKRDFYIEVFMKSKFIASPHGVRCALRPRAEWPGDRALRGARARLRL